MAQSFFAGDDASSLRQRIAVLERQLAETQQAMQAMSSGITERIRHDTERAQQQFRQAYADRDRDYRQAFAAAAQAMQQTHDKEITRLKREYKALEAKQRDLEHRLNQAHDELAEELAALQKQQQADLNRNARAAEQAAGELENVLKRAQKLPVESFYPHKLGIYRAAARRCEEMMRERMYAAAVCVAQGASLGTENVICDTNRKVREMEVIFERYAAQVDAVSELLASGCVHQMTDAQGMVLYDVDDNGLDYWSDGCYAGFLRMLGEHRSLVEEVRRQGLAEWLRGSDAPQHLREMQERLQMLPDYLHVAVGYAFSALDCYQQLFRIRETAQNVLEDQGFTLDCTRFGPVRDAMPRTKGYWHYRSAYLEQELCTEPGKIADYREERRVEFIRRMTNDAPAERIRIRMIPVRSEMLVRWKVYLEVETEHIRDPLTEEITGMLEQQRIPVSQEKCRCDAVYGRERVMSTEEAMEIAAQRSYQAMEQGYTD
ncbi:MAG: hypothetical protein IJ825_03280 [Oscillospiraceae bacterium]|nr:hypothetical protein [Oscillospiraceae bacterium]